MIIGPRDLTQDIHLEGRCFLHSYRHEDDNEGELLETILTAPLIVAQWINTQYLFSTLDNIGLGSGSKITHNILGTLGIMQGNGSDLMHGLPLQSVMVDDATPYHIPQRLLTIIYAPKQRVEAIIAKHGVLKNLFNNEWLHLCVICPHEGKMYERSKAGIWKEMEKNAQ